MMTRDDTLFEVPAIHELAFPDIHTAGGATASAESAHAWTGNEEQENSGPPPGLPGFTPAEEKALRITTTFETGRPLNPAGLAGNFDGQGLSFGMLQWNIGTGSLQPLLRE